MFRSLRPRVDDFLYKSMVRLELQLPFWSVTFRQHLLKLIRRLRCRGHGLRLHRIIGQDEKLPRVVRSGFGYQLPCLETCNCGPERWRRRRSCPNRPYFSPIQIEVPAWDRQQRRGERGCKPRARSKPQARESAALQLPNLCRKFRRACFQVIV